MSDQACAPTTAPLVPQSSLHKSGSLADITFTAISSFPHRVGLHFDLRTCCFCFIAATLCLCGRWQILITDADLQHLNRAININVKKS